MLGHKLDVVMFRVASVPLAFELAWVFAACLTLVLAVQAVVISARSLALPRAHLSQRLIVGDISGKASKFLVWKLLDNVDKLGHIIGPAEPASVAGVEVERGRGGGAVEHLARSPA